MFNQYLKIFLFHFFSLFSSAHLNDLENILPFLALGFLYVGTGPSLNWARTLFRVFTGARFVHTLVYAVYVVPQPGRLQHFLYLISFEFSYKYETFVLARALSWAAGMMVNLYLAYAVASKYASFM
jgi:glutathione S-transferase